MVELPFWALSPSPFTLIFYAIMSLYAGTKIYRLYGWGFKRIPKLGSLVTGIFMLGFVVILLDTVWLLCSGFRFGAMYLDSIPQLLACLFRNAAILALCYIYTKELLSLRATDKTFLMYLVNVAFMVLWFTFSPSPAYTDWTFALKNGYNLTVVLSSFLISHVIGKSLVALTFLTYWRK